MKPSSSPLPQSVHPLLRVQIEEWRRQAGVDSATPSAPVVEDLPRSGRRFEFRLGRILDGLEVLTARRRAARHDVGCG